MTRQTPEEITAGYEIPDPWGYKTSGADIERKRRILNVCRAAAGHQPFSRALDIACGEGWITQDLPAHIIYGYELSEEARKRFPGHVAPLWAENIQLWERSTPPPLRTFPLVVCTGALYEHYDWERFVDLIEKYASDTIVTCSISNWEHTPAIERLQGFTRKCHTTQFDYKRLDIQTTQTLRVFFK